MNSKVYSNCKGKKPIEEVNMISMTEGVQILLQQLNLLMLKAVPSFDLKILEVGMIKKPG
jgi:hypothetical protein